MGRRGLAALAVAACAITTVGVSDLGSGPQAEAAVSFERITVDTAGGDSNGPSFFQDASDDGRFVLFTSDASDLVEGDSNATRDLFLRDRLSQTTTLVSRALNGQSGLGATMTGAISADGRYVAFSSQAPNLVASDADATDDLFLFDRVTGTRTIIGVRTDGGPVDLSANLLAFSKDGRWVVYLSTNTTEHGGTNTIVRDLVSGSARALCATAFALSCSNSASITADGSLVYFTSSRTDIEVGVTGTRLFQHETSTGTTRAVRRAPQTEPLSGGAVTLSPDGRWLVRGAVYELPSWRTDPVGWSAGAGPLSDVTSLHAFSPTGRCIAFSTAAANALDPPVAGSSLVVHDRVTLTNRRVSDFLSGRFARGGADWIGAAAGALIESDLNFLPDIYVALDAAPECTLSGTSTLGSPPALVAGGPGLGSITETALSPRAVATTAERMLVLSEGLRLVDRSSGRQLLVHLSSSPTVEPIKVDDLRSPCAIAARSDGSFVIGDAASGALFTMDTSGNVARMTNIVGPCTIAVDPNDDTIVAHTDPAISPYPIVERVTSAGVRTLLAGGGNGPSDVTPAIGSRIDPTDLAIAPDGSVTLIDRYGVPAVRRIAGADLERIAGGNQGIDPGNDIPATDAVIDPEGIAWTPTGLLIAEYSRVRRVDNGGMIRGYTGTDPQTVDTDGAAPHATAFRELLDVTLGPDGVPLVVEEHTSTVRRLGGVVTTVAGHRNIGGTAPPPSPIAGDGDLASRASFRALDQVLRDGSRIVIHDGFRMRAIEPNGRVVELFRPSTARNDPAAPAVDGQGTIAYVDDHRIWKRGGDGVPTPIVGNGQSGGVTVDGPALDTALGKVRSLAFDAQGRLLFSDDSRIFRVELDGTLRVIAGGGVLTTDGVPATSRGLTRPAELAVESSGAILFAESGRLRRLTPFGDVWALLTVVPTNVTTFAPAPDGTIWFSNGARVFSRAPNGTITWVAGREGISGTDRAEQTSLGRALMPITDVLVMPDGRVQVATGATIQTVASAAPAASTFTADARFDPTLIPLLESAADFWGVPLEDLPRAGMNFLAWIIAVNPGLEPLMMTPSDNFGSTHLVTTYSPTEVVDAQRIAGFIGADLDDAHRQAALVMVFVQHLLGA